MFTPTTSVKCEKELQFDRIPEINFNEANSLCESDPHSRYSNQTIPYCKNLSFMESNKSVQCEYYFKNSISMCGHSSSYEKYKFAKNNCMSSKINSNLSVSNHEVMMNIGTLEDTLQYPINETVNYEFDIPMSLPPKERNDQHVITGSNSDENDNGKVFSSLFFENDIRAYQTVSMLNSY